MPTSPFSLEMTAFVIDQCPPPQYTCIRSQKWTVSWVSSPQPWHSTQQASRAGAVRRAWYARHSCFKHTATCSGLTHVAYIPEVSEFPNTAPRTRTHVLNNASPDIIYIVVLQISSTHSARLQLIYLGPTSWAVNGHPAPTSVLRWRSCRFTMLSRAY